MATFVDEEGGGHDGAAVDHGVVGETLRIEGEVVEDLAAGLPPDVVADGVLAEVLQTQPVREGLARGLDAHLENKCNTEVKIEQL